jgi:hypothetical protein
MCCSAQIENVWRKYLRTMCSVSLFAAVALVTPAIAQTNTFSLQADPQSIEVAPGHTSSVTISSRVVSGSPESISFDVNGLPAHVTPTFDPTSAETGSSTTLTFTAASNATLGDTATITVHGTALSDAETTTVSLRVASYVSQEEWAALNALYSATDGIAWTMNTGWDFSGTGPNGTECAWYGIECDATPHVIAITLPDNNLTGALPDFSAFSSLSTFNVFGNNLSGPLPASIQDLSALTEIVVSGNQLSESLDVLNGLSNLQHFQGDDNAFTGTVPQLGSMPNLIGFSAEGNQLTGPMPSLALSSKLSFLDVASNYLTGSFPSLNAQVQLRYLYISGNRFTGVMPNPPAPTQLLVAFLCPNFFAPIANVKWNGLSHTAPWYSDCDTDTIFAVGFGSPPSLQ